jgi:hypothetical protein
LFTIDTWNKIANGTYLISVAIAAVASVAIYQISNKISDAKDRELDQFKTQSQKEIATANAAVAIADQRAAEANARATEAALALERFKAPRTISDADAEKISAALSDLAGTEVAIYQIGDGTEPNRLAAALNSALAKAKWSTNIWTWNGGATAVGVIVYCKPDEPFSLGDKCDRIVSALNAVSIDAARQSWPWDWDKFGGMLNGPDKPVAAALRIVVGSKPQ